MPRERPKKWQKDKKKKNRRELILAVAQQVTDLTSIHNDVGSIPGLAEWVKDLAGIAVNCGVGHSCSSDPMLLWLGVG